MTLTVGSLFSGVGGFDLGFRAAGMETRWMCEIDPTCQRVLRRQFPEMETLYANVETFDGHAAAPVDLVCGGFPCTDLSIAGRRAGLAGKHSGLWYPFHRVLQEARPAWVVVENVPGLLSSHGGRDFAIVLHGLAECGYCVAWRVFNARHFGLAQQRDRLFIVGHHRDGRAGEVLFEREGVQGHPPQGSGAEQEVAGALADSTGSRGWSSSVDVQPWVAVSHALHGQPREGGADHETYLPVPPTAFHTTQDPVCGDLAFALGTNAAAMGIQTEQWRVRRFTPREYERLQGFPDDWTRWDDSGRQISDSRRYAMLGNAVPVPIIVWIGQRIARLECAA